MLNRAMGFWMILIIFMQLIIGPINMVYSETENILDPNHSINLTTDSTTSELNHNLTFNIEGDEVQFVNPGEQFEVNVDINYEIDSFRIILPASAKFYMENAKFKEVETLSDGSKIWLVKTDSASNRVSMQLTFYEKGQFSIEDSNGEIHSDFLFLETEFNSRAALARTSVNVATWAAFRTAWNTAARTRIMLTTSIHEGPTALNNRATPIELMSSSPWGTIRLSGDNRTVLNNSSSTVVGALSIVGFGLSGGTLAIEGAADVTINVNSNLQNLIINQLGRPATGNPTLRVMNQILTVGHIEIDATAIGVDYPRIETNSTIQAQTLNVSGSYSIKNTSGSQAINVPNVNIRNNAGLMSWNLNNTTNRADKAWEGLTTEIRNNSIVSSSDDTFNNDTFNISQSSWISNYGTGFGGLPPEPEEGMVTVNYLNKQGQKLKESEIITGNVGEQYTASLPEISGYYLLNKPDAVTGTIQNDPQVVNVDYVQIHDKLINPDFEEPYIESNFANIHQSEVPGWYTTASDKMIEFGLGPSHNIAGAAKGRQFVELNANEPGELYQIVTYEPGTVLRWRLYHAGRLGVDKMRLNIGHPEKPEVIKEMESPSRNWSLYNGTYIVPNNQELTYFGFEAVSSSGGNITLGNLLDDIHFAKQSELVVLNKVDKEEAPAGGMLNYSMHIENEGGVPADRLTISIIGLENTKIDTETIKINGQKLEETKFSFEDDRLIVRPDIVIDSNESIELSFDTKINSNFINGQIATHAEVDYWDEHFDDVSYSSQSNSEITVISTPVPNPLDPINPEEEVNPENPPLLPDNQGLLSIDFVSQFDFGQQLISLSDQTYFAKPQRLLNDDGTINQQEERPNYIQISDRRPESEQNECYTKGAV
ncbi:WxL domain-containing protein [Enterococcus mundtii]|uniref:Uncharacterized protein n=1 Tax=Enterococcus mundtii TaxID=53346 RepID=A0A242KNK9_ENTMU|nr:WxL domain-containing protein [Enterococcus mundtii]OTP22192.1 hypothetical protein A5802_003197 [Enterococcus mundtii]